MKKVGITLACLLSLFASARDDQNPAELKTRIDQYLSQGVGNGFSGAILVAKRGEIIINQGYGLADREQRAPYGPNTIASIGSVTKQFTGTAILKLVEFEKLKVTDTLDQFFENLPQDKKQITIHQLLTHSAGFVDVIGEGDFDHMPREVFFKTLFKTPLRYPPGSKHKYSNASYSILARIVELASGQDYERFLAEHLFQPAGMNETGYLLPKWENQRIATGYARGVLDMGSLIERFQRDGKVSWVLKGNGGIQSTLNDMYLWYRALAENKILSPSLTERLTKPYIPEQADGSSHYAYGWAIFNSNRNTKIVSHNGSNGVFFHDFLWLPEEDVVIIYSTNAYSRQVEIAWRIERMVFDKTYQPKPIKKNPYMAIYKFMQNHPPTESEALLSLIRKDYRAEFRSSRLLNRMGYIILESNQNLDWAVAIFKINTRLFAEDANVWDSLGDGYAAIRQKEKAIESYQKAVALNHQDSAKKLHKLQKK